MAELSVTSESFKHGDPLPMRHGLESENVSPPLAWTGVPDGTRSLAVVCEDPDAPSGTFVHWIAWGIDPNAGRLGEGESAPREGRNDFGNSGYDGPRPPAGHGQHRYHFRVFALDTELDVDPDASPQELAAATKGHVLATGELMGTYER